MKEGSHAGVWGEKEHLKQMKVRSIPPEVAVNPASGTPLREVGLTTQTESALRKAELETAGEIASWSAEDLQVVLAFTPKMVSEIEEVLSRLGLALRVG